MLDALVAGLLTGLSLIVAIGAQNAFVLRQGLLRQYVGPVVAVCAVSDLVLIAAGVAGIGAIVQHAPAALTVVRWLGVAFLTAYGVRSLWRARHAGALAASDRQRAAAARSPAADHRADLAEPARLPRHRAPGRLDRRPPRADRQVVVRVPEPGWPASLWFTGLGYGARLAAPLLARPRSWQVLDVLIGLTMLLIAFRLARG